MLIGRLRPLLLVASMALNGCSSGTPAGSGSASSGDTTPAAPASSAQAALVAARTDLDSTPISAADYAMYTSIMAGASALLASLDAEDRQALDLARRVEAGQHKPTAADERLLARARELRHKDEELAELQGIGPRYRQVKARVTQVVGAESQPAAKDDRVAGENRQFLAAHRENIERLQRVLADPLSRPATAK